MSQPRRCYLCGREGKIAFREQPVTIGGRAAAVWMCTNVGACGERRARLGRNGCFSVGVHEFHAAWVAAGTSTLADTAEAAK